MTPGASTDDYAAVTSYLFALKSAHGVKFGIDRMQAFAAALGHPEAGLNLVHVAGTNGKGSVVAMLDAIMHAAGWRTGMYTSPHLVKLGERVQVDRRPLSQEEITAYTHELRPVADRVSGGHAEDHPSFFEFMTAMAFMQFARQGVDIGLVEVGLGGRLDATNILTPQLCIVTSIGMDHCEMLGNTHAAIAAEKAGIIKDGVPVVIGLMPAEAETIIRQVAADHGCPVHSVAEVFGHDIEQFPHTNLEGDYQRWNAATATLAARVLGERWRITEEVITRGLQHVDWPGRWQRVRLGSRLLILDASHNPEGAQVLESNLQHLLTETGRKPVVITGVLGSVRAQPLLQVISRYAREIHLVEPNQWRACKYAELESLVTSEFGGRVVRATVAGLFPDPATCTAGGPDDVIVVTGSIYLVGEVMARLVPEGESESRLQDF